MKFNSIVFLAMTYIFCSCSGDQGSPSEKYPTSEQKAYETYKRIQATLENTGDTIDYDTLMSIHNLIVRSQHQIPHLDRILKSLIYKRNENPRVDQMILIFSAMALGKSKIPVTDAYGIFESILKMDDHRINEWVICFVSAAIGEYAFDIPQGDRLVDFLERRLDQIQTASAGSGEDYGCHFLPPPRSEFIQTYIEGIKDQYTREKERRHYYSLIYYGITETEIETALRRIRSKDINEKWNEPQLPMQYMLRNKDRLFSHIKKENRTPGSGSDD